ncbi:FecR domain-containing protein [Chitinophaga sp. CC14]|uniref:FecR family protein n=1 Tax=Chitinophaga sp. CC14 TaxID=3029199 RepID=UPI003B7CD7E5
MSEITFEELFKGYMSGALNAEEIRLFRSMALQPENRALLSQLLQDAFNDPAYAENADFDAGEMAEEIMMKARQSEAVPVLHRTRPSIIARPWFKYAAAAAIFLLLLAGSWEWSTYKKTTTGFIAQQAQIPQGTARPVLILGDGTRIALDSAANGAIARQGSAQVIKLANGQLAYKQFSQKNTGLVYNTMQTPTGCLYQLILPDGSHVWLNAASSIRYPAAFPDDKRTVEVSGEAYFDIAKDDRKPFIVTAKGMEIQVLGTAFNIMAYTDEATVKTTLVQGAVRVNAARILHPGEQAVLQHASGELSITRPDMEEILGWKNGEFYFRNTDISAIMRQVARWYDIEIKYEGDMSGIKLSGIVSRTAKISQLLKALELTKIVRFKIQGRTITVMPYQEAN